MLQTSMSMSVPKIAIVTDSTSDLAPEMIKEFGIEIIPLHVVYKDREYLDGVLEAARKLRNSTDFQGVVNVAKTVSQHIKLYFVLSTLEYLKRGGRIGYVSGTIGELLNIKPIISVNSEGKYITSAKVRGRDQSLKKLYDI
ncbi:MAG TPA: DegV family protein, partial [Desulfosporosinus sp.]|nr:DegV family protein [Desulfosporosinus sp.]